MTVLLTIVIRDRASVLVVCRVLTTKRLARPSTVRARNVVTAILWTVDILAAALL